MMDGDAISSDAIKEAIRIHRELVPGLLESVCETVLAASLARKIYKVARQVAVAIEYDGMSIENAFRIDMWLRKALLLRACQLNSYPRFMQSSL